MSTTNEIWIYDDIGPDWMGFVSGKYVISELAKFKGKPVTIRINSPGGDVVEAQAIYNALRRHSDNGGKVTTSIDALGASAASYIFQAGDEREMAENAMQMVHKASTVSWGNADQLRETAGVLDKFDSILAETYAARASMSVEDVMELLGAETWMPAKDAVEKGFADSIGTPLNVGASVKEGRFKNTPQRFVTGELPREQKRASRIEQVSQQIRLNRARLGV